MDPSTFELMREQVRAIYRAATGAAMSEVEETAASTEAAPLDEVERRFADLEAMARSIPQVAERVPPFSFEPLVDVIEGENEFVVEVAAPGVEPTDVTVERSGDVLVISGVRRGDAALQGRAYLHAEIPRGPFRRSIPLPRTAQAEPRIQVERGLICVHVARSPEPNGGASGQQ